MSSSLNDEFELSRFLSAQESSLDSALKELSEGKKKTHWMWYIFPQVDGLGGSPAAKYYSIKSVAEAEAYLHHPLLGPRLVQCCEALLGIAGKSATDVMGFPDDLKLRSSMTLFASIAEDGSVFHQVLDRYFDGDDDQKTHDILARGSSG